MHCQCISVIVVVVKSTDFFFYTHALMRQLCHHAGSYVSAYRWPMPFFAVILLKSVKRLYFYTPILRIFADAGHPVSLCAHWHHKSLLTRSEPCCCTQTHLLLRRGPCFHIIDAACLYYCEGSHTFSSTHCQCLWWCEGGNVSAHWQ